MSEYRVASYNIHRCVGTDDLYRPGRIRQVLRGLNVDIIALQEVESGAQHGELLDFFIEDSDWQYIEGPTLRRETGQYGNAILTSLPVTRYQLLDLSYRQREPRGAIDLYLRDQHHNLRVIATHLGLSIKERGFQSNRLLDLLDKPLEKNIDITLLMGDMNEWFPWSKPLRDFKRWFKHSHYVASYPTRRPLFALDRIWIKPDQCLVTASRYQSDISCIASDHYPVITALTI